MIALDGRSTRRPLLVAFLLAAPSLPRLAALRCCGLPDLARAADQPGDDRHGANDLLYVVHVVCNDDPACIQDRAPAVIQHVATNLATILAQLRAVVAAKPGTEMIVLGLYNPLFTISGADVLIENNYNPAMAAVAAQYDARFADPFPVINGNEPTSVCTYTAICTSLHDIHPTDAGYQVIANVILAASGYQGG